MENLESNNVKSSQSQDKWEYKEELGNDQVKMILREWLNALEENRDLEITVKGQTCKVPNEALTRGRTRAEYEFKKGEFELELQLKWRESDLTAKQ